MNYLAKPTKLPPWSPSSQVFLSVVAAVHLAHNEFVTTYKSFFNLRYFLFLQTVLWENPEERLKNVASTDITLMDELNGVGMFLSLFESHISGAECHPPLLHWFCNK